MTDLNAPTQIELHSSQVAATLRGLIYSAIDEAPSIHAEISCRSQWVVDRIEELIELKIKEALAEARVMGDQIWDGS